MIWNDQLLAQMDQNTQNTNPNRQTYHETAKILSDQFGESITDEQVRSVIRRYRARGKHEEVREEVREILRVTSVQDTEYTYNDLGIPLPVPSFNEKPMQLDSNSFIVFSDTHAPYHDAPLITKALQIREKHFPHVQDAILNGDTFNFEELSKHPHNGPQSKTNTDIRIGGAIIRAIANQMNVWALPGNHCQRLAKKLDVDYDFKFVVDAALDGKQTRFPVRTSNMTYMYADNWLILHPTSHSQFGGKTPAEIAELEQINVIGSHNHVIGMMQSKNGKFVGIDPGAMTRADYHWYTQQNVTKFSKWTNGFVIISHGKPYMFNDLITNWDDWK